MVMMAYSMSCTLLVPTGFRHKNGTTFNNVLSLLYNELLQVDLSYVFMSWQTVVMILWQKNAQFLCSQDQIVSKLKRVDISTRNTYENINYLFTSINIKPAHLPADSLSYSCRPWLKDVHSSSLQTGKTLTQQATRNVPNLPHTQKTDSSRHKSIN